MSLEYPSVAFTVGDDKITFVINVMDEYIVSNGTHDRFSWNITSNVNNPVSGVYNVKNNEEANTEFLSLLTPKNIGKKNKGALALFENSIVFFKVLGIMEKNNCPINYKNLLIKIIDLSTADHMIEFIPKLKDFKVSENLDILCYAVKTEKCSMVKTLLKYSDIGIDDIFINKESFIYWVSVNSSSLMTYIVGTSPNKDSACFLYEATENFIETKGASPALLERFAVAEALF